METNTHTPKPIDNNAQAGDAGLLFPKEQAAIEIIEEFEHDWSTANSGTPEELRKFIVGNFSAFKKCLLRCCGIVHFCDQTKAYLRFGKEDTKELLWDFYNVSAADVSRLRQAYPYAKAIARKFPELDVSESHMRELRGVVRRKFKALPEPKRIEKAVEVFAEVYENRGEELTAEDIQKACPPSKPKPTVKKSRKRKAESPSKPARGLTVRPLEEQVQQKPREDPAQLPISVPREEQEVRIPEHLREMLSHLLTELIHTERLDDDLKERFAEAFSKLDIEPDDGEFAGLDSYVEEDDDHEDQEKETRLPDLLTGLVTAADSEEDSDV